MCHVSFCLIARSAFTGIWLLNDVPLMITCIEYLTLGYHFAFGPELHNHAKDFSLSDYGI